LQAYAEFLWWVEMVFSFMQIQFEPGTYDRRV